VITDRLYRLAQEQPDAVFLVFEERQYRYDEFAAMVTAMAERLHGLGVRAGHHVALMCGNRPAFLVCWFALSELGAVCVPLNTGLLADGFRFSLEKSESGMLIIEPEFLAQRQQTLNEMAVAPVVVEIDDTMESKVSAPMTRRKVLDNHSDLALNSILFTSGTTGLPKGVALPHGAYEAASTDMAESLALTASDRIMVFLPLFHANPQMYAVASVLSCGATLILLPRFSASRFFDEAIRHRATGFTYVGTVLSILDKHHPNPRNDHSLRWCVGGGAPARVWEAIETRFGVAVRELYGMTETGGWVSMNTPVSARFGSVGGARRGVRLSIRDDQGQAVRPGEKGEIVAQSQDPAMFFLEYWRNPEATADTLKSGWLHTGDRGYIDADGFLYFDGRQKELIRRGGEMIAPTEIEQQLLKHECVQDCAVAGVPDDVMGEELHAYIVARGEIDAASLREYLGTRLPSYMAPRYFSFVSAIPKTETQKIKRHLLAEISTEIIDLAVTRL